MSSLQSLPTIVEMELRALALAALCCPNPEKKAELTLALRAQLGTSYLVLPVAAQAPAPSLSLPGRPERPVLVAPARVPRRSPHTHRGLAALVHAIAHIEFNAINLALDAVWRFDAMPLEFYYDWVTVAAEEATHFGLLQQQLVSLGFHYGDFAAHDGLWAMCEKTAGDITARMALVPRTLEARGLDATPLIQAKLRAVGSAEALRVVAVLDIILRDEVGHVAIGNHWYGWLCQRQGLDPIAHYHDLSRQYQAPKIHGPLNLEARQRAGFSAAELRALTHALTESLSSATAQT